MALGLDLNKVYNTNMIILKKFFYNVFLAMFLFLLPVISFSAGTIDNPLGPNGAKTIQDFIKIFLIGAIKVGLPVIALAIIYSGFLFVKAQGNPEKITEAKDALLYTLVGAAILLGAWAISQLISNTVLKLS